MIFKYFFLLLRYVFMDAVMRKKHASEPVRCITSQHQYNHGYKSTGMATRGQLGAPTPFISVGCWYSKIGTVWHSHLHSHQPCQKHFTGRGEQFTCRRSRPSPSRPVIPDMELAKPAGHGYLHMKQVIGQTSRSFSHKKTCSSFG